MIITEERSRRDPSACLDMASRDDGERTSSCATRTDLAEEYRAQIVERVSRLDSYRLLRVLIAVDEVLLELDEEAEAERAADAAKDTARADSASPSEEVSRR